MSSNRQADQRPWSLRAKLIAQQLAVVAIVCVIIGGVTELALYGFLLHQVDTQLAQANDRAQMFSRRPPDLGNGGHRPPPGQGAGTVTVQVRNGTVADAALLTQVGGLQPLTTGDITSLTGVPVDGNGRTVTLPQLGNYRVIAAAGRTDDGDAVVLITALPMTDVYDTLTSVGILLAGVSLAGLACAGLAGVLLVRRTLRPLQRVAATAGRVAELPLDRGEVALSVRVPDTDTDARTEVGQVGAALNRMLGHIGNALQARHDSETRVRQFVADASHELRTPLAAIRGYAELTRRSNEPVPPDVAHALRRVESESARMTALVDDLLLLARLDSGRPLDESEVDLSRLVTDVVGDARIAGPEHHWQLDLPAEPVTVRGDTQRLHQVLANLLSNARTHTPPGTAVRTALRVDGVDAVLSVTDDGPGIAENLLPEVFERFARGDGSRSRAAGSTGLGLAIVAAVVAAHDGTVEVTSTPGHTEFTVRLGRSQ